MRLIVTGVIAGVLATVTLGGGAMAQNPYADDMTCRQYAAWYQNCMAYRRSPPPAYQQNYPAQNYPAQNYPAQNYPYSNYPYQR